jgi:hypothetical protein
MGEAKRRKQLDPKYGKEFKEPKWEVSLGEFKKSTEITSISPAKLKEAGIKDSGHCIPYTIEDFGIGGIAYPSVSREGKILVGMVSFPALPEINQLQAEKIISLAEPKIRAAVAEAYKSKFF